MDYNNLAPLLRQTLEPTTRQDAENQLQEMKKIIEEKLSKAQVVIDSGDKN